MPKPRMPKPKQTRASQDILTRLRQHLKLSHSAPEKKTYLNRIREARKQLRLAKSPEEKEALEKKLQDAKNRLPTKKAA